VRFVQNAVGAIAGPFDSFLALRGLKTLALRMERHCSNALQLAEWLERQPGVTRVIYPGLKSHPQHALARRQMNGYGGMVSAVLAGGIERSRRFLERCQVFMLAESLGGVESLIEHPALMTHASIPPEKRAAVGIDDGLVRISVGVEDIRDLIADLEQALQNVDGCGLMLEWRIETHAKSTATGLLCKYGDRDAPVPSPSSGGGA